MFAFVDETGNTGAAMLDPDQPFFVTAALLTRSDFDARFGAEIRAIAASLGVDEIHANRLGLHVVDGIAGALLKVLRKAGPAFAMSRVEKRYVVATKVFDTLFDSYENKAVPWHVYNVVPLKIMMAFKIASLMDDGLAQQFWNALLDVNADRARVGMAAFCVELRKRVPALPDKRSRQVADEALAWAAAHPEALEFVHSDKIGRKSHLPNMVGFGNLLQAIEEQSVFWGRAVEVIKHDRQQEFAQALGFWHQMYWNARPDVVQLPLGPKLVLRKVFGSRLEISSAKESAGIQAIDVILWLFGRSMREELPPASSRLLDYVLGRARQDDFSFAGVGANAENVIDAMQRIPMSPAALADAKVLADEIEARRLEGMAEYARSAAVD